MYEKTKENEKVMLVNTVTQSSHDTIVIYCVHIFLDVLSLVLNYSYDLTAFNSHELCFPKRN